MSEVVKIEDVVLYRVSETAFSSPRPKEGDAENMTAVKAFVMTCLHRRNTDENFEREMFEWIGEHPISDLVDQGIMNRYN